MCKEEKARRCGNTERASVHSKRDAAIVPDFARACRMLPLVFGVMFAAMLAVQVAMGW